MLIVDIPMSIRCVDCEVRFMCERYLTALQKGRAEQLRPKVGDKDCLIKGELVQCGECECGEPDEEPQNDGKKYVWCKRWHAWRPEDGFCDLGKRKESGNNEKTV